MSGIFLEAFRGFSTDSETLKGRAHAKPANNHIAGIAVDDGK